MLQRVLNFSDRITGITAPANSNDIDINSVLAVMEEMKLENKKLFSKMEKKLEDYREAGGNMWVIQKRGN